MQKVAKRKKKSIRQNVSEQRSILDIKRKQINTASRNKRKARENTTNVNFLTSNSLKAIPSFKLDSIYRIGLFDCGSNPVDLIKQIYPIIEDDISIFLHSKSFNEDTDPSEFLTWMLSCYEDIYPNVLWRVYQDEDDDSWHVKRTFEYGAGHEGECIEMKWLPQLKKDNILLYELLVSTLGLLYHTVNVPFYFQDGETDYCIEITENEIESLEEDEPKDRDEEVIKELQGWVDYYKSGILEEVEKDIKETKFNVELYSSFIAESSIEKACMEFIAKAIEFMNKHQNENFWSYIHLTKEEEDEGDSYIQPYNTCAFIWSYQDDDPIYNNAQMCLQSRWENFGSLPFRMIELDNEEKEMSDFPFDWIMLLGEFYQVAKCYN